MRRTTPVRRMCDTDILILRLNPPLPKVSIVFPLAKVSCIQQLLDEIESFSDSGRYDRSAPSDGWSRSASGNMSSSVKPYSSISGGGSSSLSSRDTWNSSDRKAEQPPWMRSTVGSSTSDRYVFILVLTYRTLLCKVTYPKFLE